MEISYNNLIEVLWNYSKIFAKHVYTRHKNVLVQFVYIETVSTINSFKKSN